MGCCLICENAYPGCLCYDCKCSKCEHYSGNVDTDICNEETDGEVCMLPIYWRNISQNKSEFKIHKTIRTTEKATQSYLFNTKTQRLSTEPFWLPNSVVVNGFVREWFAQKEIRPNFKGFYEPQRRLM